MSNAVNLGIYSFEIVFVNALRLYIFTALLHKARAKHANKKMLWKTTDFHGIYFLLVHQAEITLIELLVCWEHLCLFLFFLTRALLLTRQDFHKIGHLPSIIISIANNMSLVVLLYCIKDLSGWVLVPFFPSKISLCSHIPTDFLIFPLLDISANHLPLPATYTFSCSCIL